MNYDETLSDLPGAIASEPNKYIERTMRLIAKRYEPLCEHTEKVGKITFVVSSFAAAQQKESRTADYFNV